MKRKVHKRGWREKLSADGLRYVEEHRIQQQAIAATRNTKPIDVVDLIVSKLEATVGTS